MRPSWDFSMTGLLDNHGARHVDDDAGLAGRGRAAAERS